MQTKCKEELQAVLINIWHPFSNAWKHLCDVLNSGNTGRIIQQFGIFTVQLY